jgi:hypothetical protein
VADVTADVYVIPTETPEADGTLARDLDDPGQPGLGLALRESDAERYRRG